MSELAYLEKVKPGEGIQKPESTGIKMLSLITTDDETLDPNNESYNEEAEAGCFFIKSDNLVIPIPMVVVPMEYKQMYAEFEPNRGGFRRYVTTQEARRISTDPFKFGAQTTKEGKSLQESHSFIVALPEHDWILALLNFMSSRARDGIAFNRAIREREYNGDIIASHNQVYKVSTKFKRDPKGNYYLIKPSFENFISLEEHKKITEIRKERTEFQMPMLEDNTKKADKADEEESSY